MSDLRELYQEVILDHSRKPRNFGKLEDSNRETEGYNPLCGDRMTVYLRLKDGIVEDIQFEGSGCAISTASVSMMTEVTKGKTEDEVRALFQRFQGLVTGKPDPSATDLGKLQVFAGVREFPVRVKCATLPWHTLVAALEARQQPVSTE